MKSEQESPPRPCSSAPPRGGRERTPRRRRTSESSRGSGVKLSASASSNLLAIAPIGVRARTEDEANRQRQAEFDKRLSIIESGRRSLRHAERISASAAVAFATEALELENALIVMRTL